MAGRPINESLALARLMGDKTYTGQLHTICNTTERYVSAGGCVHCARQIATEQRAARKAMKAGRLPSVQPIESEEIQHEDLTVTISACTEEIKYPEPWD